MVGQILAGLAAFPGAILLAAVVDRLRGIYRPGPRHAPWHVGPDEVLLLPCAGYCTTAVTRHEPAGDGTATCWDCGHDRPVPATTF